MSRGGAPETSDLRGTLRAFVSLERDVLVLSGAMFAFSLAFQATGRYLPEYLYLLGAGPIVVGLYGSLGNLLGAVYPYPGGAVSDRIGSRTALTVFGVLSTVGFVVWLFSDAFGSFVTPSFDIAVLAVPSLSIPIGVFVGLLLVQCWQSFGLGATFAVVKQAVEPPRLATGFASTETVRRLAFLLGPLLAAVILFRYAFETGFRVVLAIAAGAALAGTIAQSLLYDPTGDTIGRPFGGVGPLLADLRGLPSQLRPLLLGDTLVRFANGMVYAFFVIVVTRLLAVDVTLPVVGYLSPQALFGVLLAIEMTVALLTMAPVAALTRRIGLKPVVAAGFAVYALFPILLISAPADPLVVGILFAFSGLRFAGLPAHKALIVGPAERNAGGRVTGSYYLVRNAIVIPSAALGGVLYARSPVLAFGSATAVGIVGVGLFLLFGEEFEPAIAR